MKLSVSLPEEEVAFLDLYGRKRGLTSRSASLAGLLAEARHLMIEAEYEEYLATWPSEEEADWLVAPLDPTLGDD